MLHQLLDDPLQAGSEFRRHVLSVQDFQRLDQHRQCAFKRRLIRCRSGIPSGCRHRTDTPEQNATDPPPPAVVSFGGSNSTILNQLEYFQTAVPKRHGFDLVQNMDRGGSNSEFACFGSIACALGLCAFGTVEEALARPLEHISLALK
jgi:hypothetical protein